MIFLMLSVGWALFYQNLISPSIFATSGIPRYMKPENMKQYERMRIKIIHPDKNPDDIEGYQFQRLREAVEFLSVP